MFCNLVLLNVCKYFSLLTLLYSLRVSAVLDHFGYPVPHLDQWQQHVWYDLGATQEVLHQMHIRLSVKVCPWCGLGLLSLVRCP